MVVRASGQEPPWIPRWGGVLGTASWEETLGQTQDMLETSDLGAPWYPPQGGLIFPFETAAPYKLDLDKQNKTKNVPPLSVWVPSRYRGPSQSKGMQITFIFLHSPY